MPKLRVVLAGGSGLVGQTLAAHLLAGRYEVTVLTRSAGRGGTLGTPVIWDGATLGPWAQSLDGAAAVVNLAGKSVYCRHTSAAKAEIVRSRVDSVRVLAAAVGQCRQPPAVFIQASGTHFYGDPGEQICDETSPAGGGFLADVCRQWEEAFQTSDLPGVRRVHLRLGMVMSRDGGALVVLARLARCFLGGTVAGGRQYISWLHRADLCRLIQAAIERDDLAGVYNAVSPNPVTNARFMRQLRRAVHRPWSPPAPALGVRMGAWLLGFAPELALTGQRCVPRRLLDSGFAFEFPEVGPALEDLMS